jgi:two-component system, NtrC family, sensor kinase
VGPSDRIPPTPWATERNGSGQGRESGPSPQPVAKFLRAVLVVASALVLTVAALSIFRTVRSFFVLDFAVSWMEEGLHVEQVPPGSTAARAGLQDGDLIVAVDGRPPESYSDPVFVLTGGGTHELEVRQSTGEQVTLEFTGPRPRFDPLFLVRSAVAIVGLVCALIAVLTTRRREATIFLLLAMAALVLATVPHRTAATGVLLSILHRASGAAISFLLVRFFTVFPERHRITPLWDVATAAAMAISAATVVTPIGATLWPLGEVVLRAAFVAALIASAVVQLARWRRAQRVARIRRQIEWAALGMFVGLFPYAVLVLLPRSLGIVFEPFTWMAVLPVAAVPIGFLAALREYRLWDLEPITRDSVSATLVVSIGGLIFSVLNRLFLSSPLPPAPLRNLLAFATGVALVVLLQPVRRQVERFLDRWMYHGRPSPRWQVTNLTRELARTTDPRELLERLSQVLHDGLELELVATYLRSLKGPFRCVTGDGKGLPDTLSAAVTGSGFPHELELALFGAGYTLRYPLERGGIVHGLLYIGLRRGIFPLGREGRELVGTLADQAALGLESARLLDDLRHRAEEYRILHANTRRIIESSAAGILVCDATGRVLSSNVRAAAIFETRESELVGRDLRDLVELPRVWGAELPLHALNAETKTVLVEGRWVVMAVSVLELETGRFNGRVVVLQDVTEVRALERKLREQERLASLGRLASGLAHEVNTPLTGIASFAQMLGEMTADEDPRAELVAKLIEQSFRVSRIVANLHEAMRGGPAARTTVTLGETCRQAAADAERSLGLRGRVRCTVDGGEVLVTAAVGAVELAMSNLVRNALEASPPGAAVEVAVRAVDGWGEVAVDDRGPGVPAELREKVFEAFFTTRSQRGGTGLGLAITRDIIAEQGGEVRLEESPLGGTRARMRLPLYSGTAPS